MCGDREVQVQFFAHHILVLEVCGVTHHYLQLKCKYWIFHILLGVSFKFSRTAWTATNPDSILISSS